MNLGKPLLATLVSLAGLVPLQAVPIFIGTDGTGNGIFRADFNAETGAISSAEKVVAYQGPGFLALHRQKPILYCVGGPTKAFADGSGSVAAFAVGADHGLSLLGEASCGGRGPCHLAVDASGKFIAIANYGDGSVATIGLDEKGVPTGPAQVQSNQGTGPHVRQKGPHAHGVYFNRANNRLFVPDLGTDQVRHYRFDAASGALTVDQPGTTAPGAGPRHLDFHPNGRFAYVINELNNTVAVFHYDDAQGTFRAIETQPTLPEDFKGTNTTAEIEVNPNGKFLYASNRGHDSIAAWSIDPDSGKLTLIGRESSGGKGPRHFKIDPSGRFLVAANQTSGDILVLAIDPQSGALSPTPHKTHAPGAICLLFDGR